MEHLERLSKVIRYAGLNLTPQVLQIILDKNVRDLVDNLNEKVQSNPDLSLTEVDSIIDAIQVAATEQAKAEAEAAEKATKKGKKPSLAKA